MSTIEEQTADDTGRILKNGDRLMREEESRTDRGAKSSVRLIRHRKPFWYTVRAARVPSGMIAEYHGSTYGNAAMVFEAYLAGVFDLHTPLADLPAGLSRSMGRAWLQAERGRCSPRAHIVGATKDCRHRLEGAEMALGPLKWRGVPAGQCEEPEGGRGSTPSVQENDRHAR